MGLAGKRLCGISRVFRNNHLNCATSRGRTSRLDRQHSPTVKTPPWKRSCTPFRSSASRPAGYICGPEGPSAEEWMSRTRWNSLESLNLSTISLYVPYFPAGRRKVPGSLHRFQAPRGRAGLTNTAVTGGFDRLAPRATAPFTKFIANIYFHCRVGN